MDFLGLLTLLFIALKLTGYIAWSWYWVLAPMWLPMLIFAITFFVVLVFYLVVDALK